MRGRTGRALDRHRADLDAFRDDAALLETIEHGARRAAQFKGSRRPRRRQHLRHDAFVRIGAQHPDAGMLVVAVRQDRLFEPVEIRRLLCVKCANRGAAIAST
jgi:hypothetical protein